MNDLISRALGLQCAAHELMYLGADGEDIVLKVPDTDGKSEAKRS